MIQNFDTVPSGIKVEGVVYSYSIEGLTQFSKDHYDCLYSTWKTRHSLIRGILKFRPSVNFQSTPTTIDVTYPIIRSYSKNLSGLLAFKDDFRTYSSQFDTFSARREFIGSKLVNDQNCTAYLSTTEAFTIPDIVKSNQSLDWEQLMKSGTNWDALNDPTSWIEEVQLMHQVILEDQYNKVQLLSDNLPEVPVFDTYRCVDNPSFVFMRAVILMRGNCCVGKTSLLLSEELPIPTKEETSFRSYLQGVIASDHFKVKLKSWVFDDLDYKGVKFEGLVHLQSMALTDLIMNKASENGLSVILDGRYLCEVEIQRVFNLGKWSQGFGHVVIDIDGDIEDLVERSKTRKCPRIEESVIRNGQLATRNNRCVLLNSSYSVYWFKTLGYGANIIRHLVAESHKGYFQVWHRYFTEQIMPGQSVAHNNPMAIEMSQRELG